MDDNPARPRMSPPGPPADIDTSPEALRNLAIRLNNASRWRGDVLDEAAATLRALAERAAPAPAGDLVEVVARAICAAQGRSWGAADFYAQERLRHLAAAALAAGEASHE
jgi:hypothetical protein